jgi:hypothetical protein
MAQTVIMEFGSKEASMNARLKARLWGELVAAAITAVLGALTAVFPTWIEAIFSVDPDRGSGAVEWAFVGVCFVMSGLSLLAARSSWREARAG